MAERLLYAEMAGERFQQMTDWLLLQADCEMAAWRTGTEMGEESYTTQKEMAPHMTKCEPCADVRKPVWWRLA